MSGSSRAVTQTGSAITPTFYIIDCFWYHFVLSFCRSTVCVSMHWMNWRCGQTRECFRNVVELCRSNTAKVGRLNISASRDVFNSLSSCICREAAKWKRISVVKIRFRSDTGPWIFAIYRLYRLFLQQRYSRIRCLTILIA